MSQPLRAATVVVLGAARSGTKLLRDSLARHDQVAAVPHDINYVWRIGNEDLDHDELDPATLTPATERRIRGHVAHFAGSQPIVVEKTVSNCLRVAFVAQVLPEARFIHLVRDGRDVAESVERQWRAKPDWRAIARKARSFPILQAPGYATRFAGAALRRASGRGVTEAIWGPRYQGMAADLATEDLLTVCARQWARCVEASMAGLAAIPAERVHTVRYEDFVSDPRTELGRLGAFIGVKFPDETVSGIAQTVSADNVGKGSAYLQQEDHTAALTELEHGLQVLGYHDQS